MRAKQLVPEIFIHLDQRVDIEAYLKQMKDFVNSSLHRLLSIATITDLTELREAINYSVFPGGKRLRPILTLAVAEIFDLEDVAVLDCACAIEMLHCSSLVFDDLPAMDNCSFRRGNHSCHKKFGQATAILAALSLASRAFEIIARSIRKNSSAFHSLLDILTEVSSSIGFSGAAGGQFADLNPETVVDNIPDFICARKTSALFSVACTTAARLAGAPEAQIEALKSFGNHFGHAYQIRDDILDVTGEKNRIGKEASQDERNGRVTYVQSYGLAGAVKLLDDHTRNAIEAVSIFNGKAFRLEQIADCVRDRAS